MGIMHSKEHAEMETAIVTNIQGYSIHDGPGIRTVVFLKGCPMRCVWCANPENLSAEVEVGFIKGLCQSCGRCVRACKHKAILTGDGVYRINKINCVKCFRCVDNCYFGAIVRYGEIMTSIEAFEKSRKDRMFFESSGGGVTFSGGEPLLYPGFIAETSARLRSDGISICIETCGAVGWSAFEDVMPFTDYFYFDIKLMDNSRHLAFTGRENRQILENAERLVQSGADVLFRKPLVPGVNDGEEETAATAEYLLKLGVQRLELMPYHRMGQPKYEALGMDYSMRELQAADSYTDLALNRYKQMGIDCTISI